MVDKSPIGVDWARFQTEGEKRCCSTGSKRKIKSFLNSINIVEAQNTNMNLNMSMIGHL